MSDADTPRAVLMDKTLRQRAHELRQQACSAWSDVIDPPRNMNVAKCELAAALEQRLAAIINELADGYRASSGEGDGR